jgi:CheY-like chemotaxis protein
MRIVIADDDVQSRRLLETTLRDWKYEVLVAADGQQAWQALQSADAPMIAILDWQLPGVTSPSLCRRIRELDQFVPPYVILLSAAEHRAEAIAGLSHGADDFMLKPFDQDELRARLRVGARVLGLQQKLATRIRELTEVLVQIRQLQGLLPICSYCKKVRDDQNYWQQVETYIAKRSDLRFTHGICPDCYEAHIHGDLLPTGKLAHDEAHTHSE